MDFNSRAFDSDVILTISFKIIAEIEITKHMFASYLADEDVYRRFVKHNIMFFHSFIAMEYTFTLFFTVNSSVNAARIILSAEVSWKRH